MRLSVVASAPTALSWVPSWLGVAFVALLFLAVLIAVLGVTWPRSVRQERIAQIGNFGPGARAAIHAAKTNENAPVGSVIARTALAATASVVRSGRMEERISRRLERAGMRMRAHEWVLLRACVIVACAALLFAVTNWFGGFVGAAIGYVSTLLYQSVRIDRRTNQFSELLPDALQLVIGSLRSGFSLSQAFDSLAREAQEPVASEFGRALAEHRLGADISDALERLAQRVQSEDLGWAVMAVRIQREVGGNLAEVLQTTVDTMRERGRLLRHVRSLSAEGRLSAYVLIGLPLVLGTFMFVYRRAYMTPLLTDPIGILMLSLGGLLFVVGIFWMTRVVRVEA
jgi:tight adherence protein B